MRKKEKESFRERYIRNIKTTLRNIEDNTEYIMQDVKENAISNIKITIDIQPGELVNWHLEKVYYTITKDKKKNKVHYVWK